MYRSIHFRAWDEKRNSMMYSGFYVYPTGGWCVFEDSDYGKDGLHEHDISGDYDLTIMQSTGLNDKNGKEIYEGDIIQNGTNKFSRRIVKFDLQSQTGIGYNIGKSKLNEIIGNIYENPELLK